jgi:predicted metal-dependent hydrolase
MTEIKYQIKKSARSRRIRLAVFCDGSVVATAPSHLENNFIENWIRQKADWILRKVKYFEKKGFRAVPKRTRGEYKKYKESARVLAKNRLEYFSEVYGIKYGRISIRNQKTRWGSCSRSGNLNFNYKIAKIAPHMADYIIVHELCHIKEFNHSRNFWVLVAQTIPDYKNIRKQIKNL